jgi:hypothetical protein
VTPAELDAMTRGDDPPWQQEPSLPRSEPLPMHWMMPGKTYFGDTGNKPEEIDPTEIAYWAHCQSGMTALAFVRWLCRELETLDGIDPYCDK